MPSHVSAAGVWLNKFSFFGTEIQVEQEVSRPIRFSGRGNVVYKSFTFKGLWGGKFTFTMLHGSGADHSVKVTRAEGVGMGCSHKLDFKTFYFPELPKQEKIVLLKQKFIPLPTLLRKRNA